MEPDKIHLFPPVTVAFRFFIVFLWGGCHLAHHGVDLFQS
jgi:hypothetical protein